MFVQLLRIINVYLTIIKANYLFVILYLATTTCKLICMYRNELTRIRKLGSLDGAVLT